VGEARDQTLQFHVDRTRLRLERLLKCLKMSENSALFDGQGNLSQEICRPAPLTYSDNYEDVTKLKR
jgi:hypothetical protein